MRITCQGMIRFVGLFVLAIILLLPTFAFAEVDITEKVEIIKGRMISDRRTGDALIDVSIRNISTDVLLTPVKVAITSISSSAVSVGDFDGVTPEGFPYYEYALPSGQFLATETIPAKRWRFINPTRTRFSYTTQVLGSLPDSAQVMDSAGGIVATETGVVLEIPSASLMVPQVMSVTKIPDETLELTDVIDNAYLLGAADFKPDGQVFDWPVTITIPLKESKQPGAILPLYIFDEELGIFKGSGFTCEVDTGGESCTGEVLHFTDYAPGEPAETSHLWRFGNYDYAPSGTYLGSYAFFVEDNDSKSDFGPRLPNSKRFLSDNQYCIFGMSTRDCVVKTTAKIGLATKLFGSFEETDENLDNLMKEPVVFIHGYQGHNEFGKGRDYWGNFIHLINSLQIEDREFTSFEFRLFSKICGDIQVPAICQVHDIRRFAGISGF